MPLTPRVRNPTFKPDERLAFPNSDLRHKEVPAMWSEFYILLKFRFATGNILTVKIRGRMHNLKLTQKF